MFLWVREATVGPLPQDRRIRLVIFDFGALRVVAAHSYVLLVGHVVSTGIRVVLFGLLFTWWLRRRIIGRRSRGNLFAAVRGSQNEVVGADLPFDSLLGRACCEVLSGPCWRKCTLLPSV